MTKSNSMDTQDNVKIIFAYYGRAMYMVQNIEYGISCLSIADQLKYNITKARYDELSYEKSLLTFGQLKRDIEAIECFSDSELKMIDKFKELRDFLVHSFWRERAVEFFDENLHIKIIEELDKATEFLDYLNEIIDNKISASVNKNGIDIKTSLNEIVSRGMTIPLAQFRRLTKDEIVIDIFGYKNHENSQIPIFQLKDKTYWTVCEIGLTHYDFEIMEDKKVKLEILKDILPIKQFNPKPKINSPWNYTLELKIHGLKMKISKKDNATSMKWSVTA